MGIPESRSINRGTLWLIVTVLAALIMALGGVSMTVIGAWARTIEQRGLDNQARITALERQYGAIEEQLRSSASRQADMLDLLREHMRQR